MRHGDVEIVAKRIPTRQHGLILHPVFEQERRCLGDLQRGNRRVGEAFAPKRVALEVSKAPIPPNSETSFLPGLGVDAGIVSVSRYSTSS
jgi:hypothetical protein